MTSADQLQRMLSLVPYLQGRGSVGLQETADAFGISTAQLRRDLMLLWTSGLPEGLPDDLMDMDADALDEGIIRLSNADYFRRPLRLTPDEAVSLIIALRAVREVVAGEVAEAADSALAKLRGLVGEAGQEPVAIIAQSADREARAALHEAIERGRRVRLGYDNESRGRTTTPVVDPARVEVRDGIAYLHAWSLERQDWRIYRLERVSSVTQTGAAAEDHGPAPQLGRGWFDDLSADNEVELELAAQAAWICEYHPVRSVEQLPDGGVRARLVVADPGWLTGLLLRLGSGVRAVRPADAADAAVQRARAGLAAYQALARPALGEDGSAQADS